MELSMQLIDSTPPRKRKRSPSIDPTRRLYKVIELLHTRVVVLEDTIRRAKADKAEPDKIRDSVCGFAELTTSILKDPSSTSISILKDPSSTSIQFECPAVGCSRYYQRQDVLHMHIRKAQGVEHGVVKRILDGGYCLQCHKDLLSSKQLARHEKTVHKEPSSSRVNSFALVLKTVLRKSTPEPKISSPARSKICKAERHTQQKNTTESGKDLNSKNVFIASRETPPAEVVGAAEEQLRISMDNRHGSAVNSSSDAEPYREHALAQPGLPTPYLDSPIQALENHDNYNCDRRSPALSPGLSLPANFDHGKHVTGYDYRFDLAPDSIASQPEDIYKYMSGYDYSQGHFANPGSNPSHIPVASPAVDLGGQIQNSGWDYTFNVAPSPSGDSARLALVALNNQELASGYEYTNDIFGDLCSLQPQNGNPSNCRGVG